MRPPALLLDPLDGVPRGRLVPGVRQHDREAVGGEPLGDGPTDTAAATRDQCVPFHDRVPLNSLTITTEIT